jgi:arylsulfatase A-like enzyme
MNSFQLVIRSIIILAIAIVYAFPSAQTASSQDASKLPNIVFILVDDLGYGDLGCYGQSILSTPNIDRLATEGKRFTQFYAGCTVCAPSRCVLMTGKDTGHCLIRGNGRDNLGPKDLTIPEMLSARGYTCGLFGKWGLGHEGSQGIPTLKGFQSFFGYLDQTHAHNFFPSFLVRNDARFPLRNIVPGETKEGAGVASQRIDYAPDLILDEAKHFVRDNTKGPFFLMLSINMPHANNEAKEKGMQEIGFGPFATFNWPDAEKGFAENIRRMDLAVGQITDLIDGLGLADNTLILFTSDNGPHREGGHNDLFFKSSGPLRGSKRDLHEGGIRVPLIARLPNRIEPGTISNHIAGFHDLFPTLAEITASAQTPKGPGTGISFAPSMLDVTTSSQNEHEYLYWSFYEGKKGQAIRFGKWKAIEQPLGSAVRLYDLNNDIHEDDDLADTQKEIAEKAMRTMQEAYTPGVGNWKLR